MTGNDRLISLKKMHQLFLTKRNSLPVNSHFNLFGQFIWAI